MDTQSSCTRAWDKLANVGEMISLNKSGFADAVETKYMGRVTPQLFSLDNLDQLQTAIQLASLNAEEIKEWRTIKDDKPADAVVAGIVWAVEEIKRQIAASPSLKCNADTTDVSLVADFESAGAEAMITNKDLESWWCKNVKETLATCGCDVHHPDFRINYKTGHCKGCKGT